MLHEVDAHAEANESIKLLTVQIGRNVAFAKDKARQAHPILVKY